MKKFVLHDGEDEAKTEELHELLGTVNKDLLHEWEGNDSGISLYINVNQGDEIEVSECGDITIRRRKS